MGGPRRDQIPSRHMTSFRRHVPVRFLINQCQIITFLILKSDIIEKFKDRIERNSFATFESNHICIYYYFTLQLGTFVIFFLFHIEIEGKCGWIMGGRVCCPPPLSNYWEGLAPLPPSPPFLRLCLAFGT